MPRANLNRTEQAQVIHYFDLLERYQNLETDKMFPLVGVRLLFLMKGYNSVIRAMRSWGVDTVTGFAAGQLKEMARLWSFMSKEDPPPEHAQEEIKTAIKLAYDASQDKITRQRMGQFLARIDQREQMMRERALNPRSKEVN